MESLRSIKLSTPFWEFHVNRNELFQSKRNNRALSTPFWEFQNGVLVAERAIPVPPVSFYSLLGVSYENEYLVSNIRDGVAFFLLPFGSFLVVWC